MADSVLKKIMQEKKSSSVELVSVTLNLKKTDLQIAQKKADMVEITVEELLAKYLQASSAFKVEKKSSTKARKIDSSVSAGGES